MNKTTIVLLAAVTASVAQAEFTVSGEIAHQGEGILYLELLNEMQFANGDNSALGLALAFRRQGYFYFCKRACRKLCRAGVSGYKR